MRDRVNAEVGAVFAAIEDVMPDAPPMPEPAHPSVTHRRPLLVAAGAFVMVLVAVGLIALLRSEGPTEPATPPGPQGIGGDGPYLAVDSPDWTLVYAWQIAKGDGSSFILYENGDRQISTMTGSVAAEAISNMREVAGARVESDLPVEVYQWDEGVSYVWETSNRTPAVVTFGQMSPDQAESLTDYVIAVDDETFAEMIATNPSPPTTLATRNP